MHGWKPYSRFTNRIQRCWHICFESQRHCLRSSRKRFHYIMTQRAYEILTEALENDPRKSQKETMAIGAKKRFGTGL